VDLVARAAKETGLLWRRHLTTSFRALGPSSVAVRVQVVYGIMPYFLHTTKENLRHQTVFIIEHGCFTLLLLDNLEHPQAPKNGCGP
jgi:hypothetical protein